ncbi:MAG: hypothetical protein JW776_00025 [Candidatus Lokiarchaeota archaeon]|nr:hypothetical protein [Candidatus Lokiarchaeota archaeon]
MTIHFAFLFHIYQPPTQIPPVLKQIVNESYRPILETLNKYPSAKITLNINATLTEQLNDYGFNDVINSIGTLANRGQIEFTGSGKFHPLLPLLPEPEVIRQIKLNNETNKRFFGAYAPRGFFPPEMAVSEEIYDPIRKMGFDWVIMSGIANTLPVFPTDFISFHSNTSLKLVFRDDLISNDVGFNKINTIDHFVNRLNYRNIKKDYYVILAMDGETFGHHVKNGINKFLKPLFQSLEYRNDISMCTISEIIDKYPKKEPQVPKASSWSTMSFDLTQDNPFPLWLDKRNELHIELYRLIMFATTAVHLAAKYENSMDNEKKDIYRNARNFLDRGLHSCTQWWGSKRPWYSPDMILRGINEILLALINAKRSLPENAEGVKEVFESIMHGVLTSQNKIINAL